MFEFAIVGCGLAGIACAESLVRHGVTPSDILLLEATAPAAGASGAIGAMFHPIPGRSLVLRPGYAEAFFYTRDWILRQQERCGAPFCEAYPVVRPLIEGLGAEQMLRSFERGHQAYPEALEVERLSAEEVVTRFPLLAPTEGAIVFSQGLAVVYPELTRVVFSALQEQGVSTRTSAGLRSMRREKDSWWLGNQQGDAFQARHVVLAVGSDLDHWFPSLSMQMTGGELAAFAPPDGEVLDCMVSAAGYVTPTMTGEWVVGATFWHGQKYTEFSEQDIFSRLRHKGSRLVPSLQEAEPRRTWFGVRAIFRRDRQPLVGRVPGLPGLSVLSAFSSKGLLWSAWSAECLVRHLLHGEDVIHPVTRTSRVEAREWTPDQTRITSPFGGTSS